VSSAAAGDVMLEAALSRFAAVHREDPRDVAVEYHRKLGEWVLRLDPDASIALRLAAACQHIRRWAIPRTDYEEGRRGYKRWRSDLAKLHAEIARAVLQEVGYDEQTIVRVEALLRKLGLGRDPEVQTFEDAICMVFFEMDFADLAARHDDAKMIDILRKTWAKMSPAGHEAARALAAGLAERERRLVEAATS